MLPPAVPPHAAESVERRQPATAGRTCALRSASGKPLWHSDMTLVRSCKSGTEDNGPLQDDPSLHLRHFSFAAPSTISSEHVVASTRSGSRKATSIFSLVVLHSQAHPSELLLQSAPERPARTSWQPSSCARALAIFSPIPRLAPMRRTRLPRRDDWLAVAEVVPPMMLNL